MILIFIFCIFVVLTENPCGFGWKKVGQHCRDVNECRSEHGCGLRPEIEKLVPYGSVLRRKTANV